MTDPTNQSVTEPSVSDSAEPVTSASVSRRALLRGVTVAAPAILTLNSNTALGLAMTSGTIVTQAPTGTTGTVNCLDKTSVGAQLTTNRYSMGDPPYAEVVNVPSTMTYRKSARANWMGMKTAVSPEQVCSQGGDIEYTAGGGWTRLKASVDPTRYGMLSSTAVASFGAQIVIKSVTEL
jgi:hypothetical protein